MSESREGFSLVEVIVALVLLAAGMMAMQTAVVRMTRQVGTDTQLNTAIQLVEDRLALVQTDPAYDSLQTRYTASESNVAGNIGLTRATVFAHTRDSTSLGITDYQKVTVTVSGRGLASPIARTITMGAP